MKLPSFLKNFLDLDIVKNNWRLLAAFSGGVILTSVIVESSYVKTIINEAMKYSDPIIIRGKWFYKTETSDKPIEYKDAQGNIIKCTSIQGKITINKVKDSNVFNMSGRRQVCVNDENKISIRRNIGWNTVNSVIIPKTGIFMIELITDDNRLGFVKGNIEQSPKNKVVEEFSGRMHYLNPGNQTYQISTIEFCESSTFCGRRISETINSVPSSQ
ncbi:MAG: hypothetical protein MJK14_10430 [Rivularia sp. ALOHA_DT_140]|nr:hypothetical protein [Rivularia sp. ALOHA_DT_140]